MARANKNQRAARRRAAREQAARQKSSAEQTAHAQQPAQGPATGTKAPTEPQAAGPASAPAAPAGVAAPEAGEALGPAFRVAWWALLAMVFVVPIATSNFTFLGADLPSTDDAFDLVKVVVLRVFSLVALAAWAWGMLRRGGTLRRTPIEWLILAFLGWVVLTTVTSIHWPIAVFGKPRRYEGLLTFINYAVIYFLVLQFADSTARVRVLARTLFFTSIIVAGYGVLQYLGWDPMHWGTVPFEPNRAFSTYGNPNLLGGFLIITVSVALGLALTEDNLVWRMVYWVGFGLNGLALLVAFTRGAWVGGAVALVLVGVVAWRHKVRLRRLDWIPAGVSAALGVGVIWRSLSNPSEVMNFAKRLGTVFQFSGGSGQTRTEIWQSAVAAVEERPILGWGADTFRLVFPRFKPVEYVRDAGGTSVADNAHNYPLQLAAGTGIPGMLMLYGVFVWAGVRSFRTVFGRSTDPRRIVRGAFWAAAAGYLVQLMLGLSVTGATFLLWVALAVVLAPTAGVRVVRAPRWGTYAGVAVLALAALGIGYQALPLAADHELLASRASSGPARTEAARRAAELNPWDAVYRAEIGRALTAEMVDAFEAGAAAQKAGEDTSQYEAIVKQRFRDAEAALKDAIAFQPDEYDNYVLLSDLYTMAGNILNGRYYGDAITVARQGLEVSPTGTSIRLRLAEAYAATGRKDEALRELEYVVSIDPRSPDAALALAATYTKMGRVDDALAVLRALEALAPGQPGVQDAINQLEAGAAPEE